MVENYQNYSHVALYLCHSQSILQKAYEEMRKSSDAVPAVAEKPELSFVEIPYCSSAKKNGQMISGSTVAVIGTSTLKKIIRTD